jgi:hypothetical protein
MPPVCLRRRSFLAPYSPRWGELDFSELRVDRVLRSSDDVSPLLQWYLLTHEADTNTPALHHGIVGNLLAGRA